MSVPRLFVPDIAFIAGDEIEVPASEAHHAVARRLTPGETVELLDGRGHVATGEIAVLVRERRHVRLRVRIVAVRHVPPLTPRLDLFAPAPRGPRLGDMIAAVSEVGAAAWSPLLSQRAQPHALARAATARLVRITHESAKQCGRAHPLCLGPPVTFARALEQVASDAVLVLAHPGGEPYQPCRLPRIVLLVGPEGGFTDEELRQAARHGARLTRFAPHILRTETAAVVASAIILNAEHASAAP